MPNLRPGDRVVIPSTIGCGYCSYCRAGYYAQCDNANPNGADAGTCFFGGPQTTGPVDGLQAQYARVPFANVGPVWLPEEVADAATSSCRTSIRPPGSAAGRPRSARATPGWCSAPARSGSSPSPAPTSRGPGGCWSSTASAAGGTWVPGDATSQSLQWAVEAVAEAGSIGVIGVYPPRMASFPTGAAMNKNPSVTLGNCNHRRYLPHLLDLVRTGAIDPTTVLTQVEDMPAVLDAYETFDRREEGRTNVAVALA